MPRGKLFIVYQEAVDEHQRPDLPICNRNLHQPVDISANERERADIPADPAAVRHFAFRVIRGLIADAGRTARNVSGSIRGEQLRNNA